MLSKCNQTHIPGLLVVFGHLHIFIHTHTPTIPFPCPARNKTGVRHSSMLLHQALNSVVKGMLMDFKAEDWSLKTQQPACGNSRDNCLSL